MVLISFSLTLFCFRFTAVHLADYPSATYKHFISYRIVLTEFCHSSSSSIVSAKLTRIIERTVGVWSIGTVERTVLAYDPLKPTWSVHSCNSSKFCQSVLIIGQISVTKLLSLCDILVYLRMADSKLFNRIQSQSHCLSHLLSSEKHHLGLWTSHAFPICRNNLCKCCFIPRCLFCFFVINVYSVLFNVCVCHLFMRR